MDANKNWSVVLLVCSSVMTWDASAIEPVEARSIEPYKARTIEPVKARTIEPVKARTIEPVEARTIEPVKARTIEPVKARTIEPVEVRAIESVKAEAIAPVHVQPDEAKIVSKSNVTPRQPKSHKEDKERVRKDKSQPQGLNQAQIDAMEAQRRLMWNATGGDMIYR